MEQIKVFIASSIMDFESERKRLSALFSEFNNYKIKQNVFINVKFCEEMDNAIVKTRKQNEYNNYISESDIVIFLIDQECRPYTMEEFDTAIGDNNISNILVFLKEEKNSEEKDKSISDMQIKAEKNNKVAFIEYTNFPEVEQHIMNNVSKFYHSYSNLNEKNKDKNPKVIRCFLAGDHEKHIDEKNELIRFALNLNEVLVDNGYYLNIEPCTMCQVKDIKYITGADLVYYIFYDQVKYSEKEELTLVVNHFRRNSVPKIYTYFWDAPINNIQDSSIEELKNYIDTEFQHFYSLFTSVDSIKLSLLLQVVQMTENRINARLYKGEVATEQEVLLTLEDLPLFKNNITLNTLKNNLETIECNYRQTVMQFGMNPEKTELISKITTLNNERDKIEKSIQREEKAIWDMLIVMNENIANGKVDKLLKAAYRYIESGEIDKAEKILNKEKIDSVVKPVLKNKIGILKEEAKKAVNLYKQAIAVQKTLVETQETFQKIESNYQEIIEILEQVPYLDCIEVLEFAEFYDLYNNTKAEGVYKHAKVMLNDKLRVTNNETWIRFYRGYGQYLGKQNRFDEARDNLKNYLNLSEKLYNTDNYQYAVMFSDACLWFFMITKSQKIAKRGCLALERMYKERKTRENVIALASYYNQVGLNSEEIEVSKKFFDKAIKLLELEDVEDVTLANAYLNYAEELKKQDSEKKVQKDIYIQYNDFDIKKAMELLHDTLDGIVDERNVIEKYINRAIEIYEKLLENDSENQEIIMALGDAYNNLADFFDEYEKHYWAFKNLKKSEKFYERLYHMNPMKYGISLGENYIFLGDVLKSLDNKKEAVEATRKGVGIIEDVYNFNKSRFAEKLAWAYEGLGVLYRFLDDIEGEAVCYRRSIEIIEAVDEIDPTPMLVKQGIKILNIIRLSWITNIENIEDLSKNQIMLLDKSFRLVLNGVDIIPEVIMILIYMGEILICYFEKKDEQIREEYYGIMIEVYKKYLESEYMEEEKQFDINYRLAMMYCIMGQIDESMPYIEKSVLTAKSEKQQGAIYTLVNDLKSLIDTHNKE
ncbi:hypothetical protein [uncultured Eubacterium sp.]|uniref:tetratricopeptide repeat protein n=1 Tax=uncultured Eubacterium sp. TaxID=165185 RepID=UPI002595E0D0|nr:hypothetical protein [uncultured Eubacterium sp.]